MHALIYAGSLKVIPAEHSSLIGTHSSRVSFLGLSDGWAVPTKLFQRGGKLFSLFCTSSVSLLRSHSLSLSLLRSLSLSLSCALSRSLSRALSHSLSEEQKKEEMEDEKKTQQHILSG